MHSIICLNVFVYIFTYIYAYIKGIYAIRI